MTPDEMEMRINALGGQIEALRQRQDAQAQHWSQCARVALIAVVPLAILTIVSSILGIVSQKSDPITQLFGFATVLVLFLALVFQRAAAAPRRSA
jgi:uncharacterized membrane protein YfcA